MHSFIIALFSLESGSFLSCSRAALVASKFSSWSFPKVLYRDYMFSLRLMYFAPLSFVAWGDVVAVFSICMHLVYHDIARIASIIRKLIILV